MLSFIEFCLNEHYVNLIGNHPDKEKHKHEVFHILQKSYEKVGGLHGNGFKDPDDMVKNIPMWKLKKKKGKVIAATMYKQKNGRKAVAMGSDQSDEGKHAVGKMMGDDLHHNRSYSEVSDRALSFMKHNVHPDTIKKLAIHPDKVKKLMPDDEIRKPPHDDPEIVRHPELKDHFYQRKLQGEWHTKIAVGHPHKDIT